MGVTVFKHKKSAFIISLLSLIILEGCNKKKSRPAPSPSAKPAGSTSDACSADKELDLMLQLAGEKKQLDARKLKIAGLDVFSLAYTSGLRTISVDVAMDAAPGEEADYSRIQICDEEGNCTDKFKAVTNFAEMCIGNKFGDNLTAKVWACLDKGHRAKGSENYECSNEPVTERILAKASSSSTQASARAEQLCQAILALEGKASELAYEAADASGKFIARTGNFGLAGSSNSELSDQDKYFLSIAQGFYNNPQYLAKVFTDPEAVGEFHMLGSGQGDSSESLNLSAGSSECGNVADVTSGGGTGGGTGGGGSGSSAGSGGSSGGSTGSGSSGGSSGGSGGSSGGSSSGGSSTADAERIKELEEEKKALEEQLAAKGKEVDEAIAKLDAEKAELQRKLEDAPTQAEIDELKAQIAALDQEKAKITGQIAAGQVEGPVEGRIVIYKDGELETSELLKTTYILPNDMKEDSLTEKAEFLNGTEGGIPESKKCLERDGNQLKVTKCSFDQVGADFPISTDKQILSIGLSGDGLGHFRIRSDGRCLAIDTESQNKTAVFKDCRIEDPTQAFIIKNLDEETNKSQIKVVVGDATLCLTKGSPVAAQACGGNDQEFYISNILISRASEDKGNQLPDNISWLYGEKGDDHLRTAGFFLTVIGGAVLVVASGYVAYRGIRATSSTSSASTAKKLNKSLLIDDLLTLNKKNKAGFDFDTSFKNGKFTTIIDDTVDTTHGTNKKYGVVEIDVNGTKKVLVFDEASNKLIKQLNNTQLTDVDTDSKLRGKLSGTDAVTINKFSDIDSKFKTSVKGKKFGAKGFIGVAGMVAGFVAVAVGATFLGTQIAKEKEQEDEDGVHLASNPSEELLNSYGQIVDELRTVHLDKLALEKALQEEICKEMSEPSTYCKEVLGIH